MYMNNMITVQFSHKIDKKKEQERQKVHKHKNIAIS